MLLDPLPDHRIEPIQGPAHEPSAYDYEAQGTASGKLKFFSTLQFASASFYHWMCEVIPRIAVARDYTDDFRGYKIIVPTINAKSGFIAATMTLLSSAVTGAVRVPCERCGPVRESG